MKKAVFPGSFDPLTLGHLNVIERASTIFTEVAVVVAENRQKMALFSVEERLEMIREAVKHISNARCFSCDSLIVDFMKRENIHVLIRGIRVSDEYSYELELSLMNKAMYSDMETVFMGTDPQYMGLRSSLIKDIASFKGDVSGMVPAIVAEELKKKYSLL